MSLDYQQIIDDLRDEDVFRLLEQLGAQPIDKGDFILCKTICHHDNPDEANYKLYYYKNTHLFYCYSECGGQSIFSFLKHYYEARSIPYDWYKDILQVVLTCSARETSSVQTYKACRADYDARKVRKELPTFPNGILDMFLTYYPIEWLNDGITAAAMNKYNIKFSSIWNKIIIPHYNIKGELVGIRGRALNKDEIEAFGKYTPLQIEGKWYSHPLSLNLYGLDKNWENIKRTGVAIICESEKAVLQAENFSTLNCVVASCGSNLNKFQIDLLVRYCAPKEIIVCYDKEEIKGEDKYFKKLWKVCNKYSMYCNMSFVYDRKGLLEMKDSPTDRGEEVFKILLKERVKVK